MKFEDYSTIPLAFSGPLKRDTNEFANPSFEKAGSDVTIFTNLFTNPSFEAAGSSVEVWRNLAFNPRGLSSPGTWTAGLSGSTVSNTYETSGGPLPGVLDTFFRMTVTTYTSGTTAPVVSGSNVVAGQWFAVAPGDVITQSRWVRRSDGGSRNVRIGLSQADSSGTYIGDLVSGAITYTTVGQWQKITATVTVAAASAARARAVLYVDGINSTGQFDTTGVVITKTSAAPMGAAYFDGSYSPDSDLTPSWTGTANASESILTAPGLPGVDIGANILGWQSGEWAAEGSKSLRVRGLTSSGTNYGARVGPMSSFGFANGDTVTAVAKVRLETPQTGTLTANARRIWTANGSGVALGDSSNAAPNTAGEHEVRVTFTIGSATGTYLRLANGSLNEDIWWDMLTIVKAETVSEVAGRKNLCANPNFETNTNGWTVTTGTTIERTTDRARSGSASLKVTTTAGSDRGARYSISGLTVGVTYTFSAYVWQSTLVGSGQRIGIFQSGVWTTGAYTTVTGAWTRVSVTKVATATSGTIIVGTPSATTSASNEVYVDDALFEESGTLSPYFDGSTAPTPGVGNTVTVRKWDGSANASTSTEYLRTYEPYDGPVFSGDTPGYGDFDFSWTGADDESASIQTADGIDGISDDGVYRTGEWSYEGAYSAFVPEGDSIELALTGTQTVVVVARNAGQTLTVDGSTVTSTNNNNILRGTGTTDAILGPGFWDLLTIVDGEYTGPPFSGDTLSTTTVKYSWTGASDDSTSKRLSLEG